MGGASEPSAPLAWASFECDPRKSLMKPSFLRISCSLTPIVPSWSTRPFHWCSSAPCRGAGTSAGVSFLELLLDQSYLLVSFFAKPNPPDELEEDLAKTVREQQRAPGTYRIWRGC